jgi:TatD DNase family protein
VINFTDTHCHLDFDAFDEDRSAVLERARQSGIVRILIPGIDVDSCIKAIRLTEEHEEIYAAVGIHPNSANAWVDHTYATLEEMADRPKVVAIGEIGLDYYRDRTPRALQKKIFQQQLELAADLELPVVIHNRDATDDVLKILSKWHVNLVESKSALQFRPGVLHSYSATLKYANRAMEASYYVGITGPVTFKNALDLQAVVSELPLNRLLIETDAPFLSPHPLRGRRNEPANVRMVAEKIAMLKNQSLKVVARQTSVNANHLFNWGLFP